MSLNKKLELNPDFARPSNWEWLNNVIYENAIQITETRPGDTYDRIRGEDDKEFLLERLNYYISTGIKSHIFIEIVGIPKLWEKFKPFLEEKPDDLKLFLPMMGLGTKEGIDNLNLRKSVLKKKRGHPKEIQKGQLTVILVELFYFFGFNRKHSFEKVALIYTLLNNPKLILKIPENLRNLVTDFLNALPSSPSTIRGLYKRYKKLVELVNFPHSEKTRIRFTEIIPD